MLPSSAMASQTKLILSLSGLLLTATASLVALAPAASSDEPARATVVAAQAVPAPDLSECPALGRKIARDKYTEEVTADSATIKHELIATSSLYQACHLFSGSTRNDCCKTVRDKSIEACRKKVQAQEAAEDPCAPKHIDCRLLRPVKCALERTIERKRIKCCQSIDSQVLARLFEACASGAAAASVGCEVVETPAATPVGLE